MSSLYKIDGTAIEIGGGSVEGEISFENLTFGTNYKIESKRLALTYIGTTGNAWLGRVVKCKPGDTIYTNYVPISTLSKCVWVFDQYPSGGEYNYGDTNLVAHRLAVYDNDVVQTEYMPDGTHIKHYKFSIPTELTTAQAVFIAGGYANYTKDTFTDNQSYAISTLPFDTYSDYYVQNQGDSFVVDENKNILLAQSINKAINTRMYGANVLVLGDSNTMRSSFQSNIINQRFVITDGVGESTSGSGKMYGGSGWMTRIARKYGMTFTTHGRSGRRWWTKNNDTVSAVEDVKTYCNNANLAHDAFDYIILEYGTNDIAFDPEKFGTYSDVASDSVQNSVSAIRYCIESLQAKFDTASIIVLLPCIFEGAKVNSTDVANQETFIALAKQVLADYGVRWADPRHEAGLTADMICGDGLHYDYHVTYDPDKTSGTNDCDNEGVARVSRCLEAVMKES